MTKPTYYQQTDYKDAEDFKRLDFIVERIQKNCLPGASVLDIGCGNGNIARVMGSLGYNVLAVDIDENSIEKAKSMNPFPNVTFQMIDAEEFVSVKTFDAIICSEVLEHLHDYKKLLRSIHQMLNPDGVFILTIPNGYGPREMIITKPVQTLINMGFEKPLMKVKKALGYGQGTIQSSNPDLTHIQFFSKRGLFKEVRKENFELESFRKADSLERVIPFSMLAKRNYKLQELDCKMADFLPSYLASGFYTSWKLRKS
jgi:2-polyprenyl-3-methyl-5-hydroxy-6-metoxy-1,4-benzoquinol methylase